MEQSDSSVRQQEGDESVAVLQEWLEFDLLMRVFSVICCFQNRTPDGMFIC